MAKRRKAHGRPQKSNCKKTSKRLETKQVMLKERDKKRTRALRKK